jgi:predicted Fe-Mo cluster-binding NifX family protein
MKICITGSGGTLDDPVDPRFGRCQYFVFVDTETMQFESVSNPNTTAGHGAGIQSAQFVVNKGAKTVITGQIGPKAQDVFVAAGIEVITGVSGTVRQAIGRLKKGELTEGGVAPEEDEVERLKRQAKMVSKQLEEMNRKIEQLESQRSQELTPSDTQMRMRVAIPVEGGRLAAHFGHCREFTLINVDNGKIQDKISMAPPPHEPGVLPQWLQGHGVSLVIAGGMGQRAQSLFAQNGIKVIVGAPSLSAEELVNQYLRDTLVTGPNICDH